MIKIGIDIDNVVAESYPAYLERFNTRFEQNIQLAEIREFYYFNRIIGEKNFKNGKEMVEYVDSLTLNEEFQLTLPAVDSAQKVIAGWSKKGYQIHYITLRPIEAKKMTLNWLKNNGFWVKGAKLDLYDPGLGYESDLTYKREVADKNKIDVFVEDAADIASTLDIPVFLLDMPWNGGKLKKNITRVFSWKEIEEKLPSILKKL